MIQQKMPGMPDDIDVLRSLLSTNIYDYISRRPTDLRPDDQGARLCAAQACLAYLTAGVIMSHVSMVTGIEFTDKQNDRLMHIMAGRVLKNAMLARDTIVAFLNESPKTEIPEELL